MPTLKVTVDFGFVNCVRVEKHDIDDGIWNEMSDEEREHLIGEIEQEAVWNNINTSTEVI